MVSDFKEFVLENGIIALAIGVVIGSAVNDAVKSIVDGLLFPLIALVSPGTKLVTWQVELWGSVFKIGQVLNSLITFILIAFIVYFLVKGLLKKPRIEDLKK